ncbi:uncharacterized protein LOC118408678 [Branchiostoma floridae]|uniref:chitinase n=1 Tax=Branchiostoma floridae TaxID=7739 RepID=A0A9J7KCK3_BRAFL|nr:uncharacterized protein LOC118408678 [Branchiostoma floridae]
MLWSICLVILVATASGQESGFPCEGRADGVFADLEDCTVYHLCHGGRDYQIRCPDGYFWNDDVHSCRLADIAQCCSGQGVCEATSYAEDVTLLAGRVQTLESDSADVQGQVSSLTTENTALRTQLTSLKDRTNNLTVENVALRTELTSQQGQVSSLTADNVALRTQLTSLQVTAADLQGQLDNISTVPIVPRTTISAKVISAGFDDPGYLGGRGEVWVDGVQYAMNGRGYNLVTVNERTGQMEDSVRFDTYGDPAAGVSLRDFLRGLPNGRIVLIAVHDEGSRYSGDAMAELNSLGAFSPDIAHRTSWAMISKKGSKTSWFVEDERDRYAGPTVIEAEIPLSI